MSDHECGRTVLRGSAEEQRAMYDQMVAMLMPQLPPPSDAVESKEVKSMASSTAYTLLRRLRRPDLSPWPSGLTVEAG